MRIPSELREYLDDSVDPGSGDLIAAHLAACPHCHAMMEDAAELEDQVRWRELWVLHKELSSSEDNDPGRKDVSLYSEPQIPAFIQVEGFEVLGVLGTAARGWSTRPARPSSIAWSHSRC